MHRATDLAVDVLGVNVLPPGRDPLVVARVLVRWAHRAIVVRYALRVQHAVCALAAQANQVAVVVVARVVGLEDSVCRKPIKVPVCGEQAMGVGGLVFSA
jgi:hypothetical protein